MFAEFTTENWLECITLLFAAIGGGFAFCQWRKSIKTRRAEYINQLLEKLRFDEDMASAMYIVDYNPQWYSPSFHGSDLEGIIDKLFAYMNYICYLKTTKNISEEEFKVFQYEIDRVCISESSQAYLWNLYHFANRCRTTCSFINLIDYGLSKNLLPRNFKTSTLLYHKILNW